MDGEAAADGHGAGETAALRCGLAIHSALRSMIDRAGRRIGSGQPLVNWSNHWSTTGQPLVNHWKTTGQPARDAGLYLYERLCCTQAVPSPMATRLLTPADATYQLWPEKDHKMLSLIYPWSRIRGHRYRQRARLPRRRREREEGEGGGEGRGAIWTIGGT